MGTAVWSDWQDAAGDREFEDIVYEKRYREEGGGVARVSFNRPHRLNAFTGKTLREFVTAVREAEDDPTIGVIIVSSIGDHFGTGGDVEWEATGGLHGPIADFNGTLSRCWKPTIAAVKGYCIGGSNHLAYHCDLTIAAHTTIVGQTGPRVGSGASERVVAQAAEVVGLKRGKELWMVCQQYTAQEALEMGLVNAVVRLPKLEEAVLDWSDELMDLVPLGVGFVKQSFEFVGTYLNMMRVQPLMGKGFHGGAHQKEAQQAFFEKRKPRFWPKNEDAFK